MGELALGRDATEILLGFVRALRQAGLDATPDRVPAMLTATQDLGVEDPRGTFWAGRLTLCGDPDDIRVYDAVFAAYFGAGQIPVAGLPGALRYARGFTLPAQGSPGREEGPDDAPGQSPAVTWLASDLEVVRQRDVAALSETERAEVRRLISMLAPLPAPRQAARRRRARRGGVDAHRTVRRILRHGGEPVRPARWRRREKPRRLILLLDISGSMTPYADTLLRFGHAAVRCRPASTEVFTIGTRLTRITRPLRHRDPDAALRTAGETIPDWHGGTRLAEAVKIFLDRWGQRGMAHGAVVVLCSDGWERGDPAVLAGQLARLSRLAHRLVWVNPHRGKPGYAPLAGGMAAALPYLDDFVDGHSLASLENLVKVIAHA